MALAAVCGVMAQPMSGLQAAKALSSANADHVAPLTSFCKAPVCKAVAKKATATVRAQNQNEQSRKSHHSHSNKKVVNRRLILGGVAAGLAAVVGCPVCDALNGVTPGSAQAAEWSYGDLAGPNEWGEVCKTGTSQSPIDITLKAPTITTDNSLGPLSFDYKRVDASFLNTGHGTMQVNFPSGSNKCTVGGRELELLQYHFHAPSEHSFNGIRTAMEAHLVHRDAEGKLAVVGVMLQAAPKVPRNVCLEAALSFSPEEKGKQISAPVECFSIPQGAQPSGSSNKLCLKVQLSPQPLLPQPDRVDGALSYIHYKGSLTTPPCSEGVDWFVLSSPLKIPDSQVVEFMSYVGDKQTLALNSRPRQDLGERMLYVGPV